MCAYIKTVENFGHLNIYTAQNQILFIFAQNLNNWCKANHANHAMSMEKDNPNLYKKDNEVKTASVRCRL